MSAVTRLRHVLLRTVCARDYTLIAARDYSLAAKQDYSVATQRRAEHPECAVSIEDIEHAAACFKRRWLRATRPPKTPISVVAYTDGACPGNGGTSAAGGIGVHFVAVAAATGAADISEALRPEVHGRPTNQRAELYAILRAVRVLGDTPGVVEVRTDSSYAVCALTRWARQWFRASGVLLNAQPTGLTNAQSVSKLVSIGSKSVSIGSETVPTEITSVQSGISNVQSGLHNVQSRVSNVQSGISNVQSGLNNVQSESNNAANRRKAAGKQPRSWATVKNIDIIAAIARAAGARAHPVVVVHVRGHAGDIGNEHADRLARMAACSRGK